MVLALSSQGLCCRSMFFSGEALSLSAQGSVQWIAVFDLQVVRLLCCLYEASFVDYCFDNCEDLALPVQGSV